jgi:hypothetical protein
MRRILPALFACLLTIGPLVADEIGGTWDFIYQTGDGSRRATCTIELKGGELTIVQQGLGTMEGTYKEGKFVVRLPDYYSAELGLRADVKLEGSLSEGKITGNWAFDTYSGTFSAQRSGSQNQ